MSARLLFVSVEKQGDSTRHRARPERVPIPNVNRRGAASHVMIIPSSFSRLTSRLRFRRSWLVLTGQNVQFRLMTAADLDFADSLRALAGWNQTRNDWRRLLTHEPRGCFIAEWDGSPAGTSTTTCYGTDLAWIGMVLVDP